jgi:aldehyde dehydrogenase (NAD+)
MISSSALPDARPVGTRAVRDPSTGDTIAEVPVYDAEAVRSVVSEAVPAALDWGRRPPPERAAILRRAAALMGERRGSLIETLVAEGGRPQHEAVGETDKGIDTLLYYAGLVGALDGRAYLGNRAGLRHETRLEPIGVTVAITPWNVPIASPARKLAPALLAGNAMLIKPADLTPLSAIGMVEALHDAGVPTGVARVITGPGAVVGDALVGHPDAAAVSFTGSTAVGMSIRERLAGRLTRLQLELGGKNAAIVFDDADLDNALRWISVGAFAAAGQQCTATSRVLVQRGVYQQMLDRLVEEARSIRVGSAHDPETRMGPLISDEQVAAVHGFVVRAEAAGASVMAGGVPPAAGSRLYPPTIVAGAHASSEIATDEVFGPVVVVLPFDDLAEAAQLGNGTAYGLSAAVHTGSLATAEQLASALDCGVVSVNGPTAGIELSSPFGGFRQSGTDSKEHGPESLRFYTRTKLVSWGLP